MKIFFTAIFIFISFFIANAQVSFTVNSLADDNQSHPWDNPNTSTDESIDGICGDENGRCTIRAAIEEASNINQPVNLTFGVSGTINLIDALYPYDGSSINGNNQITLSGFLPLALENNCSIQGLRIQDAIVGIDVTGTNNSIGVIGGNYNEILNCTSAAISISGQNNKVYNNYLGITNNNQLMPNGVGILVSEGSNEIGKDVIGADNIICGSTVAGIILGFGSGNIIENNYIGTNIEAQTNLGNVIGIDINSDGNLIGGSSVFSPNTISGNQIGIAITAAPPDTYADQNLIVNNVIGLSKLQDAAVPNNNGISITNGVTNTKIYDNIIAGNTSTGIGIFAYDDVSYTSGHLIYRNKIGINKNNVEYGNGIGVEIYGNVEDVTIGVDEINNYEANTIIGNDETGIDITSFQGYSPNEIVFRKNIINSNGLINLFVDSLSNLGMDTPFGLSFNGNSLSGQHLLPGMIIDVYRANRFELAASAYEWLGSTNTTSTGNFSFLFNDPSVQSISVTATNPFTGLTSGFARINTVTAVEDEETLPTEFALYQNYPNPFNPTTKISWQSPVSGYQTLKVFDVLGNEVATLVNEVKSAGNYEIDFNASELSSGVYFYELHASSFVATKKMILIR
jgi:hypothetical protein